MIFLRLGSVKGKLIDPGLYSATILLAISFFLCVGFIQGCGYSFRATGEPLGIQIESIAIPLIESTSSDLGFEANFTSIVREEFIRRANVPIVSKEKAQMILTGRIFDIRTDPLTYQFTQQTVGGQLITHGVTNRRRLFAKMEAKLTDTRSGKVIWHEQEMEEKAYFLMEEDPLATRYNQQLAVQEIARLLANRLFLKTMERF